MQIMCTRLSGLKGAILLFRLCSMGFPLRKHILVCLHPRNEWCWDTDFSQFQQCQYLKQTSCCASCALVAK